MYRTNKPNPQRLRAVAKTIRTDAAVLATASVVTIALISLILRALS